MHVKQTIDERFDRQFSSIDESDSFSEINPPPSIDAHDRLHRLFMRGKGPLVCNAAWCVRVDAHVPTHARTYVARVYQEEKEEEEEEKKPRHVWRRKIVPSGSSFSLDLERKSEARILRRHFSPNLGRISPSPTPAITYRRVITARAPSLPSSHSLSLSLSFFRICRHDRNGRCERLGKLNIFLGRMHGAGHMARSRFFSVIPCASYCTRIIVNCTALSRPLTHRRKRGVSVTRTQSFSQS